jgi:DNA-binding NtrC family response regulator
MPAVGAVVPGRGVGPAGDSRAGLVVLYAPPELQLNPVHRFTTSEITVGRDPLATICLSHSTISREHFRICHSDGRWVLSDRGSLNHTFVDGETTTGEVELEAGQEVRAGFCLFKFLSADIDTYLGAEAPNAYAAPLVGGSRIRRVAADLERIAPTGLSVLIVGENGTGKETVARELHRLGGRKGPFRILHCPGIDAARVESELFASRPHAPVHPYPGPAESDPGTLYLDEIGELPPQAQPMLRRYLEQRAQRVGDGAGARSRQLQIVAGTRHDLRALVESGAFRADLFARLRDWVVKLPALRQRKEDIVPLVDAILKAGSPRGVPAVGDAFMLALCSYAWPYNFRELESVLHRCVVLAAGGEMLGVEHLPEELNQLAPFGTGAPSGRPSSVPSGDPPRRRPSKSELSALLSKHGGNVTAAAREFGKSPNQVYRWMDAFGIPLGAGRPPGR